MNTDKDYELDKKDVVLAGVFVISLILGLIVAVGVLLFGI